MTLPNVLIAGAMKAGTTSAFRYLAQHPEVSASSAKEVRYFYRRRGELTAADLADYANYFPAQGKARPVVIEASPGYLVGGTDVARKIDRYLPGSKIIFLLRDPVTRAQSHLRFLQSKSMNIGPERTMKEVLLEAQLHVDDADIWKAAGGVALSRKMYLSGCYHRYLQQYLSVLEASRIGIFFYEELQASPLRFMEGVCAFLGIDPGYYRNFNFQVENKTRFVRYGSLHRQMNRLNNQAEPLLNQYPKLRRLLRAAYYRINQEVEIEPPPDDVKIQDQQLLLNSYEKDIQQLAKLLESRFPELELPAWLHRTAPMRRHAHAVPVAADRKDQPRASHAPRVGISMSRTAPPKSK